MKLNIVRLSECRKNIGISKQEAAKRIGVSQPAYLRYESGERDPSAQVIKEIARVLNTSVDYLVGSNDFSTPDTIEVDKKTNEELFQIVSFCSQMDRSQQERLLAYIKKLKNNKSNIQ